jgi:N-formylglutamate amidohydrolase
MVRSSPARPGLVLNIPHASRSVPADLRGTFLLADRELEAELLRITDAYTDELFSERPSVAARVVFPVSRLVVDAERFENDEDEPMSRHGMGAVYTRTSEGAPLRRALDADARARLLARYWRPHHQALAAAIGRVIQQRPSCVVLDAHSFPSRPLPYEAVAPGVRPDVCLGTDPYHTPATMIRCASDRFKAAGLTVAINRPFAGTLVPSDYRRSDSRVRSLMIDVNRKLYMDERTGARNAGFAGLRELLGAVVDALNELDASAPIFTRQLRRTPAG